MTLNYRLSWKGDLPDFILGQNSNPSMNIWEKDEAPMRVYATINFKNLDHNIEMMRRCMAPGEKMCAVIKADGYGHGAVPIALHIEKNDLIWGFAVAAVSEARDLRDAGITKPILILGYVFGQDHRALVEMDVRPAVFTLEDAIEIDAAAKDAGKVLPIHIALDTGMSRIGFADTKESADKVLEISKLENITIEGMFTHFARADELDKTVTNNAFSRYLAFCDLLKERGIEIPIRHCSNSAAILELPEAHLDMVRAGITLYGIYPSDEVVRDKDMLPLMELKSHVSYVKEVPAGTPVSYGGTYITERTTTIATIPVGYADGYPRSLSSKGCVLIKGRRVPILGRVCMDQFMVDVTGMDVKAGEEVTLMGEDSGEFIGVDELGALSGRFPYEFVCDISMRVPRVYVE